MKLLLMDAEGTIYNTVTKDLSGDQALADLLLDVDDAIADIHPLGLLHGVEGAAGQEIGRAHV